MPWAGIGLSEIPTWHDAMGWYRIEWDTNMIWCHGLVWEWVGYQHDMMPWAGMGMIRIPTWYDGIYIYIYVRVIVTTVLFLLTFIKSFLKNCCGVILLPRNSIRVKELLPRAGHVSERLTRRGPCPRKTYLEQSMSPAGPVLRTNSQSGWPAFHHESSHGRCACPFHLSSLLSYLCCHRNCWSTTSWLWTLC